MSSSPDRWVDDDDEGTNGPSDLARKLFPVGTAIERRIDNKWFQATVVDGYVEAGELVYDIEYRDDGNQELEVPGHEIRLATTSPETSWPSPVSCEAPLAAYDCSRRVDDAEPSTPVATLHGTQGDDLTPTFVVNGAGTKLGAGGGLHCVRFLRESVNMR